MAELRIHQAAVVRVPARPTLRIHYAALVRVPAAQTRQLRIHAAWVTRGFEPPVSAGATRVRWQGAWVNSRRRVRWQGQWV